jgi:hypothetical protein
LVSFCALVVGDQSKVAMGMKSTTLNHNVHIYTISTTIESQCQYSRIEIGTKSIHPSKIKGLVIVQMPHLNLLFNE